MSYTTSEHELLKSDVLKSSLGFVTERDAQHIIQLYVTLFYLLFLTVNLTRKPWEIHVYTHMHKADLEAVNTGIYALCCNCFLLGVLLLLSLSQTVNL